MHTTPLDPARCPLCGELNQCAMEIARLTGQAQETCWCVSATFTPELLATLPQAAQNRVCICEKCAAISAKSLI